MGDISALKNTSTAKNILPNKIMKLVNELLVVPLTPLIIYFHLNSYIQEYSKGDGRLFFV